MQDLDLPQSVRVAIQSRLAKLPDPVLDVLRMAAVLGLEFDFETLASAMDQDEDPLIGALEVAERSQLIEELSGERGGTFRFAHALIATALAEDLSGLRRRRMHGRAADAIRDLRPDDFESLAYHYSESGDSQEGLAYSLKAGERAIGLSAYNEALKYLDHALEIAEAQGLTDESIRILESIGDVQSGRDFNRSVAAYQRAMELSPSREKQAELKAKIGTVNALSGDERGLPLLEEAISELDPATQASQLAQAIASLGRFYHNRGQHGQAIEHLERARQIAEPIEDPGALLYIYTYLAGAYQHLAEFQLSLKWAQRSIQFGEQRDLLTSTSAGHEYHAENFNFMGHWEDGLVHARKDHEIGEKTGLLDRVAWGGLSVMWACHGLGRLREAIEAGQRTLEMAEGSGDSRLAVLAGAELARVLADLGDLQSAQAAAELAAQRATDLNQAYMICEGLGALAYQHAQRREWKATLECRRRIAEAAEGTDNRLIPMLNGPGLAEAHLELGQLEQASKSLATALQTARESGSPIPEARALRVRARIQAAQGDWAQAVADFGRAAELCQQWQSRLLLAQVLLDWGQLQAGHEGPQPARKSLERALEIFAECGAHFWVGRTRDAIRQLAVQGADR
jgi:tetratricopeptide (TPR) repeat protein